MASTSLKQAQEMLHLLGVPRLAAQSPALRPYLPFDLVSRIIKEADGGRYAAKQKMDKVVYHFNKAVAWMEDEHEDAKMKDFAQDEESAADLREMAAELFGGAAAPRAKMISLAEGTMEKAWSKRNADDFEFYMYFQDYHNWDNASYARGEIWSPPPPAWLEALPSQSMSWDGARTPMGYISDGEFQLDDMVY